MFKYVKANNGISLKSGNMQAQSTKSALTSPYTLNPISNNNGIKTTSDLSIKTASSNKRTLTQYEELSNISEERPEILAVSSFNPLYDEDGNKTEHGNLFDVYVEALKQIDSTTRKLLKELDDKEFVKNKNNKFKQEITNLRNKLSMLNNLLKMLSSAGANLNLHNKIYDFSPSKFVEKSFNDGDSRKTKKIDLAPLAEKLPENLNLDIILSELKNLPQNGSIKYSSSKLWISAINELRHLLFSHSRHLLKIDTKNNDDNFSSLPNDGYLRLDLEKFKKSVGDVSIETVDTISTAMGSIDYLLGLIKDDESKIALIFHLITKEIRHSLCFNNESQSLKTFRGPGTSPITSKNFFDNVFGMYPANTDIFQKSPDFTNINSSLMDLCYSRDLSNQNRAVLNLEEKEPTHINSELIVGSKYFFDAETIFTQVVGQTINVERINNFQKLLSRLDNNFFDLMSNFGLLPTSDSAFGLLEQESNELSQIPEIISLDSITFLKNVMSYMIDDEGASKTYQLDPDLDGVSGQDTYFFKQSDRGVDAIFSLAAQENEFGRSIKASLFLLINDMANANENIEIDKNLFKLLTANSFVQNSDVLNTIITTNTNMDAWLTNQFITLVPTVEDPLKEMIKNLRAAYNNIKSAPYATYVPCKFDTAEVLGQTIRKNSFIKNLAKIMKELKNVYIKYACKGKTTSEFQQVGVNTILLLFFNAICRMSSLFSNNTVVAITTNDTTGGALASRQNELTKDGLRGKNGNGVAGAALVGAVYGTTFGPLGTAIGAALGAAAAVVEGIFETPVILNDADVDNALNVLGYARYGLVFYVNFNNVPKSITKTQITSYAQQELKTLLKLSLGILNTLDVLNANIKMIDSAIKKFSSEAIGFLLKYLNNDAKKLSLVLKEPQLMLMLSTVEDTFQSFNGFSDDNKKQENLFTNYIENISHYPKMTEIFELLFKDNEQLTLKKGYNKKILSIGIPQGLFEKLLKTSARNIKNSKHDDIFKISVYKTDILNGNTIYHPKVFLFEASRYPVRNYSDIHTTKNSNYHEIFKAIPTRNYSLFTDAKLINVGNSVYSDNKSNAFGKEYSFLSDDEKNQLIENHVTSFLLENYLKIMTGMTFNDISFNLNSKETEGLFNLINDEVLKEEVNKPIDLSIPKDSNLDNKGSPFANAVRAFAKKKYSKSASTQQIVSATRNIHMLGAVTGMFQPVDSYISKILQPKKFDRVFNIIFDPEFQVDYEKTIATAAGAAEFNLSLRQKKFIKINNRRNEYVDTDKSPQDISIENFFISIETHAEEYTLPLSTRIPANSFGTTIKNNLISNTTNNVYRK